MDKEEEVRGVREQRSMKRLKMMQRASPEQTQCGPAFPQTSGSPRHRDRRRTAVPPGP